MPRPARLAAGSDARQQRAERILDTTAELLAAYGYRRVTIDDVAARSKIGKGTVYLHWRTREALFWAVLEREALHLFEDLVQVLRDDPASALPHALLPRIFTEIAHRPLVKALLLADTEVLGSLTADETVRAAQQELTGYPDYLELARRHGALRTDLTAAGAAHILMCVMRGFLAAEEAGDGQDLDLTDRAALLGDVLRRSLEPEQLPAPDSVPGRELQSAVTSMFAQMAADYREHIQRA